MSHKGAIAIAIDFGASRASRIVFMLIGLTGLDRNPHAFFGFFSGMVFLNLKGGRDHAGPSQGVELARFSSKEFMLKLFLFGVVLPQRLVSQGTPRAR
jgi:hypothetical protein